VRREFVGTNSNAAGVSRGFRQAPLRNMQGKVYAMNKKTSIKTDKGKAAVINGKRGDRHYITCVFPLGVAVGTGAGTPVIGSTTSANGYNSIIVDPFQMGGNVAPLASMYNEYNLAAMEIDFERTVGQDTTLAKGRIVVAIIDDPCYPLYAETTFQALEQMENQAVWSVNPNENGGKANMAIKYTNKEKKLRYCYNNIAFPSGFTKANSAQIREAFQCAIMMQQVGAYVPASQAAVASLGYLTVKMTLDTYGRADYESVVNIARAQEMRLRAMAATHHQNSKEPESHEDNVLKVYNPMGQYDERIGVVGHHVPKSTIDRLRRYISDAALQPTVYNSDADDDDSDDESANADDLNAMLTTKPNDNDDAAQLREILSEVVVAAYQKWTAAPQPKASSQMAASTLLDMGDQLDGRVQLLQCCRDLSKRSAAIMHAVSELRTECQLRFFGAKPDGKVGPDMKEKKQSADVKDIPAVTPVVSTVDSKAVVDVTPIAAAKVEIAPRKVLRARSASPATRPNCSAAQSAVSVPKAN